MADDKYSIDIELQTNIDDILSKVRSDTQKEVERISSSTSKALEKNINKLSVESMKVQSKAAIEASKMQTKVAIEAANIQSKAATSASKIQSFEAIEAAKIQSREAMNASRIQSREALTSKTLQERSAIAVANIKAREAIRSNKEIERLAIETARIQSREAVNTSRVQSREAMNASRSQSREAIAASNVQSREAMNASRIQSREAMSAATLQQRAAREATRIQEAEARQATRIERQRISELRRLRSEGLRSLNDIALRYGMVGAAGIGAFAYMVKGSSEFEQAMAKVGAKADATGSELKMLKDQALNLTKYGFDVKTIIQAQNTLAGMGYTADQISKSLGGMATAAKASGNELDETATLIATIMNIYKISADQAVNVADILAMADIKSAASLETMKYALNYAAAPAKTLGISLKEVTASIMLLANAGYRAETIGTSLRGGLLRLADPKIQKTLDKMGVSIKDSIGEIRPIGDILDQLRNKLSGLGEVEKAGVLKKIFGVTAVSAWMTLIDQGSTSLNGFVNELNNAAGASERASNIIMDNLAGDAQKMQGAFSELTVTIGNKFTPVLRPATQEITKLLDVMTQIPSVSQNTTLAFGATLVTGLALTGSIAGIVGGFISLSASISAILPGVGLFGISLGALVGWLPVLIAGIVAIGVGIYTWNKQNEVTIKSTSQLKTETEELNKQMATSIQAMDSEAVSTGTLMNKFDKLAESKQRDKFWSEKLNVLTDDMIAKYPGLTGLINQMKISVLNNSGAYRQLSEEVQNAISKMMALKAIDPIIKQRVKIDIEKSKVDEAILEKQIESKKIKSFNAFTKTISFGEAPSISNYTEDQINKLKEKSKQLSTESDKLLSDISKKYKSSMDRSKLNLNISRTPELNTGGFKLPDIDTVKSRASNVHKKIINDQIKDTEKAKRESLKNIEELKKKQEEATRYDIALLNRKLLNEKISTKEIYNIKLDIAKKESLLYKKGTGEYEEKQNEIIKLTKEKNQKIAEDQYQSEEDSANLRIVSENLSAEEIFSIRENLLIRKKELMGQELSAHEKMLLEISKKEAEASENQRKRSEQIKNIDYQRSLSAERIKNEEDNNQYLYDMGVISEKDLLKLKQDYAEKDLENKLKDLEDKKKLNYTTLEDATDLEKQITLLKEQQNNLRLQNSREIQKLETQLARDFINDTKNSTQEALSGLIQGKSTLGEAFSGIFDSINKSFSDMIAKMIVDWIMGTSLMKSATDMFTVSKTLSNATIAASNTGVTASNMALASSNAMVGTSAVAAGTATGGAASIMGGFGSSVMSAVGSTAMLAVKMLALAVASIAIAVSLPIIALGSAMLAITAPLAAVGLGVLTAGMAIMTPIAATFAPLAVALGVSFLTMAAGIWASATGMIALALSSLVVAFTMPKIAFAITAIAITAPIAAISLGIMSMAMLLMTPVSLIFAASTLAIAAGLSVIALSSRLAATGMRKLAIAMAASSVAWIPFIGAALAPLAAISTGLAIDTAALKPFDTGTPYVPNDMVAKIHEGEMIIPSKPAQTFREFMSGKEMPGNEKNKQTNVNISYNVNAMDSKDVRRFFEKNASELSRVMDNSIRSGNNNSHKPSWSAA